MEAIDVENDQYCQKNRSLDREGRTYRRPFHDENDSDACDGNKRKGIHWGGKILVVGCELFLELDRCNGLP